MPWLQLRFDFNSTRVRLPSEGHRVHSGVTRAADPLVAVAMTYFGRSAAARSRRRSSNGRSAVELQSIIVVVIAALYLRRDCGAHWSAVGRPISV